MLSIDYRRRFGRHDFFREWMAGRALRRRKPDFTRERPMVSIIGDAVSDIIRAEQVYERDILEFVRDRILDPAAAAASVALDIGANIGNHNLFLSDIFKRIIAFEPNPLARSLLQINLDLNGVDNVELRPVGLSDRDGSATIEFDPLNLGAASSGRLREPSEITRQQVIDLRVGDQVLDESEAITFIKIDVEGAEEQALRGLRETLRVHAPVVMLEQWSEVIDAQSGTSPTFSFMREQGYSAWDIRTSRLFVRPWGKLASLFFGRTDYQLVPIHRMEKREYPALIFTPTSYVFPPQS